ncbi:MAG: YdcF family protein [Azospirillum sp.]|nr:YdcF family protein [Azospirillum sp.]
MAMGRSRRRGGAVHGLTLLLLVTGIAAVAWAVGLIWFAETIPREAPAPDSPEGQQITDAIVVLTGGSERLSTGLELLGAGRAKKLFVSGVYHTVDVRELLLLSRQAPGELECCIELGYAADSTMGNAAETADWMAEENFTSLRLVTANYHMRRSLLEFRMALPRAEVLPHPVIPANVHLADWWQWPGTANLIVNEYNKYLIALGRHGLIWALDGQEDQ